MSDSSIAQWRLPPRPKAGPGSWLGKRQIQAAIAIGLTLTLVWAFVLWNLNLSQTAVQREARQTTLFRSQVFSEYTAATIKRIDEVLLDLRQDWLEQPEQFSQQIQQRQAFLHDINFQAAVIGADSHLVYPPAAPFGQALERDNHALFRTQRDSHTDQLLIGSQADVQRTGHPSIQFTRPIYRQHRFQGLMLVLLEPELFTGFGNSLQLGSNDLLAVVNDQGDILAHPRMSPKMQAQRLTGVPFLTPEAPLHGNYTGLAQADGIGHIFGYTRIPEFSITTVIGQSVASVLAPYHAYRRQLVGIALVVSAGVVVLLVLLFRSLQKHDMANAQWRRALDMLHSAIDTIGEAFAVYDPEDRLVYFNKEYADVYRISADLLVPGKRFEDIIRAGAKRGQYPEAIGRVDEWLAERMAAHRSGNSQTVQQTGDGRWLKVSERLTPEGFTVGFRVDITELQNSKAKIEAQRDALVRSAAELERLAQTDALSGLNNRRHFMVLAEQELARKVRYGGELSVLMIDIDHFKTVNDKHGHQAGDEVLRRLGQVLRDTFRDIDVIGRLGGEEFAVMLPQTNPTQAIEAAERLQQKIAATTLPLASGCPLFPTVSIGVATSTGADTTLDILLGWADQALYQTKNAGRNQICTSP